MGWKKFIKTVRTQTGETISEETSKKAVDLYRTRYNYVPALWKFLDSLISVLFGDNKACAVPWNFPVSFVKQAIILPSDLQIRFPNLRQETGERGYMEWVYDVYRKGRLEKAKLYGGKVLENISQGLAGELCKESMLRMGDSVVGQVHDEIHVLCKKGLGLMTAAKLKRAMSLAPSWMPNIILDAEVHVGSSWSECK